MSKSIQQELDRICSTAKCWLITLSNKHQIGLTDHDTDLIIERVVYHAKGAAVSVITQNLTSDSDNFEIKNILDHDTIKVSDVLKGLYDNAKIEMFIIDCEDLKTKYWSKTGFIADISVQGQVIIANIKCLKKFFEKHIVESYSQNCRAEFGDKKCKIDIEKHSFQIKIQECIDKRQLYIKPKIQNTSLYFHGKVRFESGQNQGLTIDIESIRDDCITLMLPATFNIEQDCLASLIAGCDRNFSTCHSLYNNVINFRGEPYIPHAAEIV